ncbi:hypothetical protein [Novosphingobium sp. ES2-1]|uniref:hypothetical protein n=1 Tax=Novosphingobium sp. ES2-1 TaxID=2780074 RepID=UPI00187FDDE4|nr:hypothetical protein [Novosphingobium sp. ES2-1]QOV95261.1 hypothetical protein IM701_07545 [Novosphingobium sp. ES2-1]
MPDKYSTARSNEADTIGTAVAEYTPADADLPINVKAVLFDADGTISVKNTSGGAAITGFPVIKGMPLPFIPLRITAMTGPTKCYLVS